MSASGDISDSDIVDGLSVRYIKIMGLWSSINFYRKTGRKNAVLRINFYFVLALCIPHVACQFLSYFMTRVDLQKSTVLSLHALGCLQLCARHVLLWTRFGAQCQIFDLLRKDFLRSIPEYKKHEVDNIYKRTSARTNLLCSASLAINLICLSSFIADPTFPVDYIRYGVGSMAAFSGGRNKILGGWYPVPMSEAPFYEIIYVYEAFIKAWVGINLTVFASMFYQPLMCLYAHIAALSHHIATLKADAKDTETNSTIYDELYAIIQDHQKLIRYTELLKKLYNPLVTMILAMGLLLLTFTIVQLLFGGVRISTLSVKLLIFCSFQAIEVIMFCLGSSSVEGASLDLSFAIYSSEWYKANLRYRRTALMFMIRARKGMTLTAIKMYPVNKETMVAIFRFTYTAATVLSRIVE